MIYNETDLGRRALLRIGAAVGVAGVGGLMSPAASAIPAPDQTPRGWECDPMRWFQLAFTEDDPGHYSPQFWLDYFKQIHADGACLSAGGGIAFYPTKVPYHGKARGLGDRDPFGEMVAGCKALGMRVLARVDPHAMPTEVFQAHPEWAACSADGKPRHHWTASDLYLTCPYTDYNFDLMVKVVNEIVSTYPVDGLFGNRVNTLGVCYCQKCKDLCGAATSGMAIPLDTDPGKPDGRRYWAWAETRIMELIDLWDRTIQSARPNTFFVVGTERRAPVDYNAKRFGERTHIVFCDRQARSTEESPFSPGEQVWGSGRFTKELRAYMFDKPVGNIISVGWRSLGALLKHELRLQVLPRAPGPSMTNARNFRFPEDGEQCLSRWRVDHLAYGFAPVDHDVRGIERRLIAELQPPLDLTALSGWRNPDAAKVRRARSECQAEARLIQSGARGAQ